MKNIFLTCAVCAALFTLSACDKTSTEKYTDYPIHDVSLTNVTLTDSFWLPKIQTIQEKTIRYAFEKCAEEGRFENFVTAGVVMRGGQGKTRGAMPFDDTDVYKTIEGAAYSLINAPNPKLDAYLDSVIGIIQQGQEPDGYLTTWRTINPKEPPCNWVKHGGGRWFDLANSHELYNAGHMYEAAAAHYYATGKRNFLDIALKNADLIVQVFGDSANAQVPGHEIIETGLIKLYDITGREDYLLLSKKLMDLRGDTARREVYGAYNQDHIPVTRQEEVVGHAVRAVYLYAGMTDIAAIMRDAAYHTAVNKLWENMVGKKMYVTGGLGARHNGEAFGENYELPNLTAYSETCAAIGGVYWNDRLFRLTGDAKYYNVLERMLYNALLAGISYSGTEFFYPNPLEADGRYRFNKGHLTRAPWFDCSCCPTNLIRFIPYIPNLIYATEGTNLFVNLFIASQADIQVGDQTIRLSQETDYPWNGNIRLTVNTPATQKMQLRIRIPGWIYNEVAPGGLYRYTEQVIPYNYRVSINGEVVSRNLIDKGYLVIDRTWSDGDTVELQLPMQVRQVAVDELVTDDIGKVAYERGPLVYCAEELDNLLSYDRMKAANLDNLVAEFKPDLLGGINVLRGADGSMLLPYYAWSNRGVGRMKVFFEE
ncbi:MAG: glycoside hydrolase family 127 protein [Prevotellaceae bacterium]|jgi:DUF1680 family protein|nr:glycoside hydrolase family 127 protein [Prevotellaceae bacterium]